MKLFLLKYNSPILPRTGFSGIHRRWYLLVLSILLTGCITQQPVTQPGQNNLFQTSVLDFLLAGNFDGDMTIESLKRHGDFGLGTFNALDGEMIVLDGNVYQARDDGNVYLAENESQTPFAVVTFFNSQETVRMKETLNCNNLHSALDAIFPDLDMPYAIKISGDYASLKLRAPPRQARPYKTLSEALASQVIFELGGTTGTMVGFRLPEYMAGLNASGYHFHFISEDRLQGGHVLDCVSSDITVMADTLESVHADLSNRR